MVKVRLTNYALVGMLCFVLCWQGGSAVNCYSCTYTLSSDPSLHLECVHSPWNFTTGQKVLNCPFYCNTHRRYEHPTSVGKRGLTSFSRGCAPNNEGFKNNCVVDAYGSTCYTSCRSPDLCNAGTGIPNGYDENGAKTSGSDQQMIDTFVLMFTSLLCLLILS